MGIRRIGFVIGLAVLTGLAWLLLGPAPEEDGDAASPGRAPAAEGSSVSRDRIDPTADPDSDGESAGGAAEGERGSGCARIRVVTEDGSPVAGAVVALWEAKDPDFSYWDAVCRGTTDARGEVSLVPPGPDRAFNLKAEAPREREGLLSAVRKGVRLEDTRVVLPAERFVSGVVTDLHHQVVPGASVICRTADGLGPGTLADGDGRFRIGGLREGAVSLTVVPGDWSMTEAAGEPVTVRAGEESVRLILRPDVEMTLLIRNWPVGIRGSAVLAVEDHPEIGHAWRLSIDESGRARIGGLRPHLTYALYVGGQLEGFSCYLPGIPAVDGEYGVELRPGLEIRGKVIFPGKPYGVSVWARREDLRGMSVYGRAEPDGRYRIPDLAEGVWEVHARASYREPPYSRSGSAEIRAGEEADLELR